LSTLLSTPLDTWSVRGKFYERPIRVMRIITRLNVGGPAYQAIYLTERLQRADFDCSLLVGRLGPDEGSMEALATERGVPFTRVAGLGREISPRTDGLTVYRLYQHMRQFRPDIVHTHLAKAGAVGRLAARLARVPAVVHTYHGHVFHGYFSKRKSRLVIGIERALAQWTDRLVVLGEPQEREILGYGVGKPEQMARIPLGLELEPFLSAEKQRGRLRRELGIESRAPVIGIVARLVPIKAHGLFLEAARAVANACPETQFLIVGDGECRQALQEQALALGFPIVSYAPGRPPSRWRPQAEIHQSLSTVHFLGFRSDLPAIYADLDVVVLCSRNEGLPVSLIEALAAARPVVSTDVGAVRDLVIPGRTGRLTAPGSAPDLAGAILQQLRDSPAAEAMAQAGREHVYPHLSIDRLERDVYHLYYHLAEEKGLDKRLARRYLESPAAQVGGR
jgi:glycosyltransferase involved in cell wall biosynthesis